MNSDTLTLGRMEAKAVDDATGITIPSNPAYRDELQIRLAKTWGAGRRWKEGECKVCGREIAQETITLQLPDLPPIPVAITVCQDCAEPVSEHYAADKTTNKISMTPWWDENCPERFKELIELRKWPAGFVVDAFSRVQEWRPSERKGMALVGHSGSGKTTSLWALAQTLEREGCNPKLLTGIELGRVLGKAARDIDAVEWLWRCRVLMIDDFGKERATPAASGLLWEVLDKRYQSSRPVIISTRFSGAELRERFSEKYLGDDIVRRLNELCRKIDFTINP